MIMIMELSNNIIDQGFKNRVDSYMPDSAVSSDLSLAVTSIPGLPRFCQPGRSYYYPLPLTPLLDPSLPAKKYVLDELVRYTNNSWARSVASVVQNAAIAVDR